MNYTHLDQEYWTPEQRAGLVPPIEDSQGPDILTDQDFESESESDSEGEPEAHPDHVIPSVSGPTVGGAKETRIDQSGEDSNHPPDRYSDQELRDLLQVEAEQLQEIIDENVNPTRWWIYDDEN